MPSPLESDEVAARILLPDITSDISTRCSRSSPWPRPRCASPDPSGKGIGLFAGAGVAGAAAGVRLRQCRWGLGQYIENQWSALVVAAVWAIVAVILYLAGRRELQRVQGLPNTTETLSKVPNALKGHEEENR